jgi:hypothetical protein
VARRFLGGGGHFMHGGGHLVGARELLAGALGHQGGNGVEFATGAVEVGGTALQAAKGVGQEVAQNIRGHGQVAQFVLTTRIYLLVEVALAELRDMGDQFADRVDQVAVDQPQAEQGND